MINLLKLDNVVFLPLVVLVIGSIISGYYVYSQFSIAYNLDVFAV